jgi:quinol monooxygenase YgiN
MWVFIGLGQIKTDHIDEIKKTVSEYVRYVQREPGTIEYRVFQGKDDPRLIAFYEIYSDQTAKDQHNEAPELKIMMDLLTNALENQPMMGFMEEFAAKSPEQEKDRNA